MSHRVEISRGALLANIQVFRELCPTSAFMAVVKSNAYGHGLEQVVSIAREATDWFGVNSVAEALMVRKFAPDTPILVMGRAADDREYRELRHADPRIHVSISVSEDLAVLAEHAPQTPFHLKIDTGMGRLGARDQELKKVLETLAAAPRSPWAGVMTHFANVEDVTNRNYAEEQLRRFDRDLLLAARAAGERRLFRHAAASAPAMLMPDARLDIIRVGISLYGLWPSSETRISLRAETGSLPELRPVMRWTTSVVRLNLIAADEYIGYGCTYRTRMETRVAVLPVGYFEGYDRALGNRAQVLIRGKRAPVIGRVCMNMIMVDVSHIPDARVGDEAVLIGEQNGESVGADELAEQSGTINYEVVTRVEKDLPRIITS